MSKSGFKMKNHSGMIEKNSVSRIIFCICNYGFFILFSIICILPIWHVVMASFSDPRVLMGTSGLVLKPLGEATLEGYKLVLSNMAILKGYLNTFLYVAWVAIAGTALTTLAGFLISRNDFLLAKPLSLFILFTMMFSGGLIPSYMVIRQLGMINTRWALMLPGITNAFYIMMISGSLKALPASYEESAKLDGAGPVTIMVKILLPLIKANLAVVVMFNVIGMWNSWYPASIYLPRARELWPLQLVMREMLIENDMKSVITSSDTKNAVDYVANLCKYCVTVVGTLPILCAYPFAQKYFVAGVQLGGVKG